MPSAIEIKSPEFEEGLKLLKDNKFDQSIEFGQNWLKNDPENLNAYLLLSLAYLGKGQEGGMLDQVKKVHAIKPQYNAIIFATAASFYATKNHFYKALDYYEQSRKIEEIPWVVTEIAKIYQGRGQLRKAREYYEKNQDDANLGRIYLAENNCAKAIGHALKAIEKDKQNAGMYIILASCNLQTGNFELAQENYLKLKAFDPEKSFVADYYLGLVDLVNKKYDIAQKRFDDALRNTPKAKELNIAAAFISHNNGDFSKAKQYASRANTSDPNDFLGYLALADIFVSENNYLKADQTFKKAKILFPEFSLPGFKSADFFDSGVPSEPASLTLANILYREGLFAQVLTLDKKSKNPFILMTKARAEMKLGNTEKAKAYYQEVIGRHPALFTAFMELGSIHASKSENTQAISMYEKAGQIDRNNIKPLMALADLYYNSGKIDESLRKYEQIIAKSPNSAIGYNQAAWVLSEDKKKYDEALTYARKGIKAAPDDMNMQDTLGWIYYRLGKYSDALKSYKYFSETGRGTPSNLYHLGMIHEKLNKQEMAGKLFEKALDMSDDFPEVSDTEKRFKVLTQNNN
ncbi:MAG: tetratricopeptide repeat protein [Proteobacteria bacterium]|nr:tetratricopeptide repeat protein [Pseudomonadota bacterium]MBU1709785.1 tetratricopeptide repeat protein [Pseudomonadota bacterium]